MKRTFPFLAVLLMMACGHSKFNSETAVNDSISTEQNLPGDSTVYGLACDGCNDTILVFLSRKGGDPDTFNILNASRHHHVIGRPKIGDKLAIVVNRQDSCVADLVIDLEELKGQWCYMVQPKPRRQAGMPAMPKKHKDTEEDSLFRKMMEPREYGVELKSDYIARPIGMVYAMTSDEEAPVVFPPLKKYREWHIFNGQLVLHETARDTSGTVSITNSDTAQFVMLRRDTLVLQFPDGSQQGYYRKTETPKEN